MAFNIETDFSEVGSHSNKSDGGQLYSVSSDADTLGAMMVSGYLDALATAGKINVQDMIVLSGTDGAQLVMVASITAGVVVVSKVDNTGIALAVSNPSAIAITHRSVDMTSASATPTPSLADGAIGQLLNITMVVDDGDIVITPANGLGYSTITFADAGDSVQLEMKSGGWAVIGQGGLSTGPVVA